MGIRGMTPNLKATSDRMDFPPSHESDDEHCLSVVDSYKNSDCSRVLNALRMKRLISFVALVLLHLYLSS